MGIQNKTVLTKDLLTRFNFANLFYRLRFNLIIFPLLMLACAGFLYQQGGTFLYVQILICFAVIVPVVLIVSNIGIFTSNMKNYPLLNKEVKMVFSESGFTLNDEAGTSEMISYQYLKECVEFKKIFVLYFKGALPMVIDKNGFSFADSRSFKALMKKSVNKRSKRG